MVVNASAHGRSDGVSGQVRLASRLALGSLLVGGLLVGCSGGNTDSAEGGNEPTVVLEPRGWQLIWADEFDGDSLDASKWNVQLGDGTAEGIPGWGNNELQSYQADNVSVAGGNLVITAMQESVPVDGRDYSSGRINTRGKLDVRYGRIEASIHAAGGQGMWSAFWMLPSHDSYGGWAAGGELDIMEVFSRDPQPFTQAALHYGMAWPLNALKYAMDTDVDPADGFHVYAVEWDAEQIRWFVDGRHFYTVRNATYWNYYKDAATNAHVEGGDSAPFDRPFHLLLNLAVGGNLPGAPTADAFPGELRVDYVRVYECNIDRDTGVGCAGFADSTDPNVVPPLPDGVYRASYDLYTDALDPIQFPDIEDVVALDFGVYDADGALTIAEIATDGDHGTVIDVITSGGGNFSIFPASLERQTFYGMGSAQDPGNYAGEIQFDLYIFGDQTDLDGAVQVKIDSGFPDLGFVELALADLPHDVWSTVTVQISDIAHNPGNFGGGPVDLSQVLSLFVFEPTSSGHFQVDNVRIICGHTGEGDCGIAPPAPPPPPSGEPQLVFIDAVDPLWDVGIQAADSGTGFANYGDGTNPDNKVQWRTLDVAERGTILEISFSDSGAFGVWFIQSSMGVDLSSFASGMVSFDIKVDDYGANETGMTMKIDCIFPCTSGDQPIGKVGDGDWETVQIPVGQLVGGGLNLGSVNTGIVVFPTDQSTALTFHLDNVQWLPGDVEPPPPMTMSVVLYDGALADGWALWDCCGGATFGEVEDDADRGNVVELAFGGSPTVTGFEAAAGVDVSGADVLEFDFKEVSPPPEGAIWRLKLESSNAATAVEVLLTDAGNPAPNAEWQRYRFSLASDLAGLDVTDLKLVMMFPDWGNADGAVARIDNVRFVPAPAAIDLYADAPAEGWYLWDCCGGATFAEVADDADRGNVIELAFGAGATVTGLQNASGIDASSAIGGTLEFDFKEVSPSPADSSWRLKLESVGAATFVEVLLTDAGNPMPTSTWQSYSFGFDTALAGLDLSNLNLVMFFPDWGNADGAVARIDNIRLVPPQ